MPEQPKRTNINDPRSPVCLLLDVASNAARTIHTEVADRRLRICDNDEPILWAAGSPVLWGLEAYVARHFSFGETFSAAECRRIRDANLDQANWWQAWAHRLTSTLNLRGPIGAGHWIFERTHVSSRYDDRIVDELVHAVVEPPDDELNDYPNVQVDWDISGQNQVLPLRALGPEDDSRLNALTKLASDRSLPPALLWWHSGFQRNVVLDGHVRLAAFRAAKQPVLALTISQRRPLGDSERRDSFRAKRIAVFERQIADPVIRNREIARLYDELPDYRHVTRSEMLTGGSRVWDLEVESVSPPYAARVRSFLAELEDGPAESA